VSASASRRTSGPLGSSSPPPIAGPAASAGTSTYVVLHIYASPPNPPTDEHFLASSISLVEGLLQRLPLAAVPPGVAPAHAGPSHARSFRFRNTRSLYPPPPPTRSAILLSVPTQPVAC
jgi:hypothetical protein